MDLADILGKFSYLHISIFGYIIFTIASVLLSLLEKYKVLSVISSLVVRAQIDPDEQTKMKREVNIYSLLMPLSELF